MRAKLVQVNVPSDAPGDTARFYAELFGVDLARSLTDDLEAYHAPVSPDGTYVTVTQRMDPRQVAVTCYFAVDDLGEAVRRLEAAGGTVISGPHDAAVPPRARNFYANSIEGLGGSAADVQMVRTDGMLVSVMHIADPQGNVIGLMQLASSARVFFKINQFALSPSPTGEINSLTAQQMEIHGRALDAGRKFAADPKAVL